MVIGFCDDSLGFSSSQQCNVLWQHTLCKLRNVVFHHKVSLLFRHEHTSGIGSYSEGSFPLYARGGMHVNIDNHKCFKVSDIATEWALYGMLKFDIKLISFYFRTCKIDQSYHHGTMVRDKIAKSQETWQRHQILLTIRQHNLHIYHFFRCNRRGKQTHRQIKLGTKRVKLYQNNLSK